MKPGSGFVRIQPRTPDPKPWQPVPAQTLQTDYSNFVMRMLGGLTDNLLKKGETPRDTYISLDVTDGHGLPVERSKCRHRTDLRSERRL